MRKTLTFHRPLPALSVALFVGLFPARSPAPFPASRAGMFSGQYLLLTEPPSTQPVISDSSPSREAFVNKVFRTVVDSSFSSYLLSANAYPCSFLKFEYDEWVKYTLREDVPIYVLNELAAKSFADRGDCSWRSDSLVHAICIDEGRADSLLVPSMLNGHAPTAAAWKAWRSLPPERRTVFYFSRPLFTDDGNYAILDMDYRCDNRLCGVGSTCLFRKTAEGWRLAGRKKNW